MKFDDLYRKIILEDSIQEDWDKFQTRYIKQIDNDDQFFEEYILPISDKVNTHKSLENTFRVQGKYTDVIDFLKKFKVDKKFLENPQEFQLIAPMIVLSTNYFEHKNQFNEGFLPNEAFDKYSTMVNNNLTHTIVQGRWQNFYQKLEEFDYQTRVKTCTPKQLINHIKHLLELNNITDTKDLYLCLQFYINCRGVWNGRLDEHSTITDPHMRIK